VLLGQLAGHFASREFVFLNLTLKIMGPATIIFVLGLIDDFWGVSAYGKFAVQVGAAALLFWNGFGISRLSLLAGYPQLAGCCAVAAGIQQARMFLANSSL